MLEGDSNLLEETLDFLLLEVHDGIEHLVDGVQNIHAERTLVVIVLLLGPLLCFGVEEVLSPQSDDNRKENTLRFKKVSQ